jgi:Uma2 family endonuclease
MEARQLNPSFTVDDIYNLPEGERAELIDGKIYMMAPPNRQHQYVSKVLFTAINDYIRSKGGPCDVYYAPFAVFLNKDDKNYFEPDISVICDPDKLTDKGCNGAPDWIIEIASPTNLSHDYIRKLNKYMAAGVREYWIVDPVNQLVAVYFFATGMMVEEYKFTDQIKVGIYDDFYIELGEMDFA